MKIGSYSLSSNVLLAPMAGITDKPFRQLCRSFGASLATSEMITSNQSLWSTKKTLLRTDHFGEIQPISVQIAGSDPLQLATAAELSVQNGAHIIDINMGCPAKKVCNVLAGSALLKDEQLVFDILKTVVDAVDVPVTLKTRLGWDDEHKNIESIAKIAEQTGISALAIHGRTRTQMYQGNAEYDLIAQVKKEVTIPIIVNGDIVNKEIAKKVLDKTAADAIMIGRGAQGRPWIFREIIAYLNKAEVISPLSVAEIIQVILSHLESMYLFYGEYSGCRIARKHISWYIRDLESNNEFRQKMNALDSTAEQFACVSQFLKQKQECLEIWPQA